MKTEFEVIEISEEVVVGVKPDVEHEWLISTADVAEGYGLSASGVRSSKERYSDELEEGKHFVVMSQNGTKGGRPSTYWTKKGVIRLGFLIKTPLAKQFRDWAEDFIIKKSEEEAQPQTPALPKTYLEALEDLVAKERLLLEQAPVVEAYNDLTHQDKDTITDMTLNEVAKELGYMPRKEFNPMLRTAGIIFKNSTEPKAEYVKKKWFRGTPLKRGSYECMSWKVTALGMAEMLKKFGRKNDLPDVKK